MIGIYDEALNPFVYAAVNQKGRCLDVGCWTGNLGVRLIKEKACTIDGLDTNEQALDRARKRGYHLTFKVNLNNDDSVLPHFEEKYDSIICADVIEHLIYPKRVLEHLRQGLSAKGRLIVSVPNICFVQQRLLHLLGRFDYNPKGGIMDATHFVHYSRKTIQELLISCGYRIDRCEGYALVRNRYWFLRYLSKLWPTLFAPQFLVIASKL